MVRERIRDLAQRREVQILTFWGEGVYNDEPAGDCVVLLAFPDPERPLSAPIPLPIAGSRHDHRLKPLLAKQAGTLVIHEVYRSLQGEGTWAGLPCVFVRLTACHLRCSYCDTPHAFHRGEPIAVEDLVEQTLALAAPGDLIEVTGGEPLLQPEVFPLMTRLADSGHLVLLETSGACDIGPVDPRVRIILDLKTPGSGEADANLWENLPKLKPTDEVKVVVCDRADFDWTVGHIRAHQLTERCEVLISPAHGKVEPASLATWILESGLPLRLQVQLHKQLWGPDARGV